MPAITDSPLARSTEAIRLIGIHGPIKLRDLEAHVSFSRSALHRICAQLEALNWARRRVSDKAYVLTYATDDFFASAQFSAPEVDQVQPVLAMAKVEGCYDLTLSMFKTKCNLQMSTAPSRRPTGPRNIRCFSQMRRFLRSR
ncbi:hypothetical protein N8914_06560 [Planktomarina temperata]|nr:hypothetical protein [Planktomarina temperata]